MKRYEGKVAVVTGGNSGIGLATAKAFAREGAAVVISGRDEKTLKSAEAEIGNGAMAVRADASKLSDLDALFEKVKARHKKIDALFVNAGVGKFVPFDQVTEAFYDEIMDINVKGVFFTVQKALPLMSSGAGVVLNASINGHKGMPGTTVYGPAKAAVLNLARTMSADLVSKGIRVNSISPGPIQSAILNRMGMSEDKLKETREWIQGQIPMKRFGTGDEIAEAVLYLCSPAAGFTIGADLVIDGGMIM
jgi:NAD(P)-dependent dehydrogenase (short-subunit alcohol dehydrogenase family)